MREDWKECKLGEVCYFAKDKVSVSELNNDIYISTENMMPNRGGITKATNLPTGEQTLSFESGDILVSNIRPYFKKIWKATFSGGCSADVLNFKAKNNIANDFLYYVLSDDEFFKYCMTTSKGTKMPRGDKVAIMQYPITLPPLATQQKIAAILSSLDDKIELNNKINDNLEQQAQAIYDELFNNDDRNIILGDIIETTSGGTPSRKNMAFYTNGNYCWVKSKELQCSFIIDTEEKITDDAINNSAAKLLPKNSVLIAMYGATVGAYGIISKDMTCNQAICALLPNENYPYSYLFMFAKNITHELENLAVGSAQQNISQVLIKKLKVHSDTNKIKEFHSYTHSLFEKKLLIEQENKNLSNLRDTLYNEPIKPHNKRRRIKV